MNLQNTKRLTDLENKLMGAGGKGIVRDFGKVMYTLLYLKWIPNKDLVYSTGNSLNVLCQSGCEGCLGENGYMCMHS